MQIAQCDKEDIMYSNYETSEGHEEVRLAVLGMMRKYTILCELDYNAFEDRATLC